MICQCEHGHHFEDGNNCHAYGAEVGEIVEVQTQWGLYEVCPECAKNHLAKYAMKEEPDV